MQCLRLVDDRHRNIGIAPFPQNLVVKDELELVFNHAHRNSELHRTASLALRDPAGVFLENRKHLLVVRDRLAFEKTPLHLVYLPACMGNQRLDHARLRHTCLLQLLETLLGSVDQVTATFEIGFDSVRLALRASRRADLVETLLHLLGEMSPLAPASDVVLPRRSAQLPEQAPHRVPQQVDIGRVVHVGLDHKRITAPAQRLARLFSCDRVAALHN